MKEIAFLILALYLFVKLLIISNLLFNKDYLTEGFTSKQLIGLSSEYGGMLILVIIIYHA